MVMGLLLEAVRKEQDRRVIYQDETFIDLLIRKRYTPGKLVMCQVKLLQAAADTLLDNELHGHPMRDAHSKVYMSLWNHRRG